MPSWNIHIAHAERLLEGDGPVARAVRDRNAFMFGNLVPDVYVGYMVPGVVHPIPYRVTHFAVPEHIPKPREAEFWQLYVDPLAREFGLGELADSTSDASIPTGSLAREVAHVSPAHAPTYVLEFDPANSACFQDEAFKEAALSSNARCATRRSVFDMVLGTWVHLLADTIWNQRVSDYLDALGEKPSRDFRIKKQGDFDQFGKSLELDSFPVPTPGLIDAAVQFPQYAIDERSVYFACAIAHETVRTNHLSASASYRLLSEEFFSATFDEVQCCAALLMNERL